MYFFNKKQIHSLLYNETGVHRLIRKSPFNPGRHTSFASVIIYPELKNNGYINQSEIEIHTLKSSGPGGQHVNKTESAVRVTHKPTGITVKSQSERSQHLNKQIALNILYSKLNTIKTLENLNSINEIRNGTGENCFGYQVRTYTLDPYLQIKDHRIDKKFFNVDKILNGQLDDIIKSHLEYYFYNY